MKTIVKSDIFGGETIVVNNPIIFNVDDIIEKTSFFENNGIKSKTVDIYLNGPHLIFCEVEVLNGLYTIDVEHDFSFIKLHFELEGNNEYIPDNKEESSIFIPGGHYNLFYLPNIKGKLVYQTHKRKTCEITFTEQYLQELFHAKFDKAVPCLGYAIQNKMAYKMWSENKKICPKLYDLIEDIKQCSYSGKIKKAYLESKIVEILMYLFSIILDDEKPDNTFEISEVDYHKILNVEKILKEDFLDKHSLKSLAISVGLNDFKIKKYFKMVYGDTVFGYLTKIRMEYAKNYLQEYESSVAQIAEELGYKNPHHFSVAFKKTFGYLPSKIKTKSIV